MFSPEGQNLAFKEKISEAAKRVAGAKSVALTGSGISVASGIMPFRGKGGLWEKYDPEEMASIETFKRNPKNAWVMHKEVYEVVGKARPNPAHFALARLEAMGLMRSVITQNIDGLHQKAGNKTVIEFHGNIIKLICLECAALYPTSETDLSSLPPLCPVCRGVLKPNAVFFGEAIPRQALYRAHEETQQCRVMLVVGTSGIVEPAASLPLVAKSKGAYIIEVNPEPSYLTASVTALFLQGKAEEILPAILEELNPL